MIYKAYFLHQVGFIKHTMNTEDYADHRLQEQDWATVVCFNLPLRA